MTESTLQTPPATGVFCWHELNTKDVEAAKSFYSQLCGWEAQAIDMGGFTYNMLSKDGTSFGGIMDASGPEWEGVPAHWMIYVAVDDVDVSAEKVKELGGKICVPPTDIPNVGRFSVVSDPTGGTFSLFKSASPMTVATTMVWNELMTRDVPAAIAFYTALLGWTTEVMPMGPGSDYTILKNGDTGIGGIFDMNLPELENVPPHWLAYIGTNDVDGDAAKVTELGGTILKPPTDIPNVGRFTVFSDPTGGCIALYQIAAQE